MFAPTRRARPLSRASFNLNLAILAAFVAFAPAMAQEPTPHAPAATPRAIALVVRNAASGEPLDAAELVHTAPGRPLAVIGRADATGRIEFLVDRLTVRGEAIAGTLLVRRIGYAPQNFTAAEFLRHVATHQAATHEVLLLPRPALLSSIAVEAAAPNQLATGTALAVTTADRATITEQATTSLAEALDGVEGVTTSRVGAWGSKINLRGLGGERLAYMVDGARVNRACTFGMDQGLATVDPANVERVELLAGPGSTLYGSGNVGGAVNVVTRNPALSLPDGAVSGEVRMGASSAVPGGTAGLGLWTRRGSFDLALQMDGQRYGDYRTPDGTVAGSSYRAATADLKAGLTISPAQRLAFQYSEYAARDIGWPSMAGASIPEEGRRKVALDWGWQRGDGVVDALNARAYVQRLDHHMVVDMVMPMSGGMGEQPGGGMTGASDGMTMQSTTDARSYSTTAGARAQVRLRPDHHTHLDAGVEAVEWSAEGTRWVTTSRTGGASNTIAYHTWPEVRILDLGVFAQGERELTDRLTVSGGARADRITKRASGWQPAEQMVGTGNLGGRLDLGGGVGLRVSAGLGYRVPDPTELFGIAARPDGYVYRGNPELTTETGRTVEAGLTWDGALHALLVHEASFGITAFRNDLRDMIAPALATGDSIAGKPVREYVNVAEARLTGVTATLRADVSPALRLSGSATMVRGEDLRRQAPLTAVPPLTGALTLRFAPDAESGVVPWMASRRGWFEVEGRAAARQSRAATDMGEVMTPGWEVLTIRAGATLGGVALAASVDNLLDRGYREHLDPVSLQRPGRNVSVRIVRGF